MSKPKPLEDVTLVLDNGADIIKIGVVLESAKEKNGGQEGSSNCLNVPNFIAKSKTGKKRFISTQIANCHDTSGLYIIRAFDRGYMSAFDVQKTIWDHIIGPDALNVDPTQTDLLLTEPVNNFKYTKGVLAEMLFEDYAFRSVCMIPAAQLAEANYTDSKISSGSMALSQESSSTSATATVQTPPPPPSRRSFNKPCTLVVDSGFSFTHVIPFVNGKMVEPEIRRINVGGKVLTNQLKEIISYRQFNVLDETYLVNQVKEDTCFVSSDYNADMEQAKLKWPDNKIYQEYVLPDFSTHRRGYVRAAEEFTKRPEGGEQILKMNNERFSVPELLFNPSDIGLNQMGLGDLIHQVVSTFPDLVQSFLYTNILLIGGNAKFPGYRDRVYSEVRMLAPEDFDVCVTLVDDPIGYACHGGNKLAYTGRLEKYMTSRDQYFEKGKIKTVRSLHK